MFTGCGTALVTPFRQNLALDDDALRRANARQDRCGMVAELLGGPRVLPRHEVGKLFEARARYGVTSYNRMEPSRPIVAEDNAAEDVDRGRLSITRDELIALVDEALRSRGLPT